MGNTTNGRIPIPGTAKRTLGHQQSPRSPWSLHKDLRAPQPRPCKGWASWGSDNYDAALLAFSDVVSLYPDYAIAYAYWAEAHRRLGMERD
jgi:hypothetical protein